MHRSIVHVLALFVTLALAGWPALAAQQGAPLLIGPYLGQQPPGAEPRVFAPGIVSTGMLDRDIAITPDGREIYFSLGTPGYEVCVLAVCRLLDGRWSDPEVAPFSGLPGIGDLEPAISPDGGRFFFLSTRPRPGKGAQDRNEDIWVMDRQGERWGEPYPVGAPIDTDDKEYFPSVTRDGTLYFTRAKQGERENVIFRSRLVDGRYQEAVRLPAQVNAGVNRFNAFIAPDESYLLLSVLGRPDAVGRSDYYVVFRSPDDTWSEPINLGPLINRPGGMGFSPYVSPDGKYLFFMSVRPRGELNAERLTRSRLLELWRGPENTLADTSWVDAGFLAKLRPAVPPPGTAGAAAQPRAP
jgi:hypothetical protein